LAAPVRTGRVLCGIAVLLAAGAASGCLKPERVHYVPGPELAKGLECQTVRLTGELVPTRRCTMKPQRDAEAQGAQDARDFLNRQPIAACPGSPGCKD